jgi:uncharacterized protein involved in exopolysaccharide biosynthesis
MDDPTPPEVQADEATVLGLVEILLRRRLLILGCATATAIVTVLLGLLFPSQYTSSTSFVPEVSSSRQLPAGIAGLAGQLGLSLGGGATTSPRFFVDVMLSRETMDRVLLTRFRDREATAAADSATLLALLEVDGDNALDSLEQGRDDLSKRLSAQVDAETGIITFAVTTWDRELSAGIANTYIVYLDEFNTQSRQSKAREQRAFVEGRLQQSAEELREAELRLKSFYEGNRTWQQSPQLTFLEGQLRRRVEVPQEVYLTLSREYEKSRIEEVNDTPAITVIERAIPVQERSSPRLKLLGAMALVLGGGAGVMLALAMEYLHRLRAGDPAAYARLVALLPRRRRPAA